MQLFQQQMTDHTAGRAKIKSAFNHDQIRALLDFKQTDKNQIVVKKRQKSILESLQQKKNVLNAKKTYTTDFYSLEFKITFLSDIFNLPTLGKIPFTFFYYNYVHLLYKYINNIITLKKV